MLCFLSNLFATGLREPVRSEFELFAFECPRAVRCTRTHCCWRLIGSLRRQTHHMFRFRNHTFLFSKFCFLHLPFRHGFTVVNWTDMAAREHRKAHDDKRRRWFHSPRVKQPFVIISSSWFLVSTHLIWISGSKLMMSNIQSSATLWVRDTCLIVGLRLVISILMIFGGFFGWVSILQIIVSKMNCGWESDSLKHSPYQRIHIEVLHVVFWLASELLSQIRVDFLEVWNVRTRYVEVVRPLRVVVVVVATIENSTLRHCKLSLQPQVSLHKL